MTYRSTFLFVAAFVLAGVCMLNLLLLAANQSYSETTRQQAVGHRAAYMHYAEQLERQR